MGKCAAILHIVRLRQMLRCWRRRAASASSSRPPPDVPAGHVAVCVGSFARRYVVKAADLNHPAFHRLLAWAAEESGSPVHSGLLALPSCDEDVFEAVLRNVAAASSPPRRLRGQNCRRCRHESLPLLVEEPFC